MPLTALYHDRPALTNSVLNRNYQMGRRIRLHDQLCLTWRSEAHRLNKSFDIMPELEPNGFAMKPIADRRHRTLARMATNDTMVNV